MLETCLVSQLLIHFQVLHHKMKLGDVKRHHQDLTELDQDLETEMVHSRKKNETPILQAMKNIM